MESSNTTTFTDSIVFDVIKEIAERAEAGLNKYGTTMDRTDLNASDWVQHAYEEALDMAIYLKRLRKDMLAMEEELRAFKLQNIIKEKLQQDSSSKEVYSEESRNPSSKNIGMKLVYKNMPKPNETYTDLEEHKPRRTWHY